MPDYDELYREHNAQMEDFWSRRANAPRFERTIRVFGYPVIFYSNHAKLLDSADMAEGMYSSANWTEQPTWRIHLIVHDSALLPGPPPERLVDLIHFAGADDWLSIRLSEWGNCFVDMTRGEAHAVLNSAVAEQPDQICRLLINTILTNLITRHGYSMLHASALIKDGRVLLLQAPHGTGKSTTALRLLLSGYKLLSDSLVYVGERGGALWMGGFPVGRIKLRTDMLPLFPELAKWTHPEHVGGEIKHALELDEVSPSLACREMVPIDQVEICVLERWDKSYSQVEPLTQKELWPEIMVNSLHYDTPELWHENLRKIDLLLNHSNLHRLKIGTSEDEILKTVNQLWTPK